MKAQHAPTSGRAADGRQASRSDPVHTASTIRKSISGGVTQMSATAISTVRTPLPTLGNRLPLIHASMPAVAGGGGRGRKKGGGPRENLATAGRLRGGGFSLQIHQNPRQTGANRGL